MCIPVDTLWLVYLVTVQKQNSFTVSNPKHRFKFKLSRFKGIPHFKHLIVWRYFTPVLGLSVNIKLFWRYLLKRYSSVLKRNVINNSEHHDLKRCSVCKVTERLRTSVCSCVHWDRDRRRGSCSFYLCLKCKSLCKVRTQHVADVIVCVWGASRIFMPVGGGGGVCY